jgi:hypothetical protein
VKAADAGLRYFSPTAAVPATVTISAASRPANRCSLAPFLAAIRQHRNQAWRKTLEVTVSVQRFLPAPYPRPSLELAMLWPARFERLPLSSSARG